MSTTETNPVQKTILQRWLGWRVVVILLVLTPLLLPLAIRAWRLRGVPDFPEPFDTKLVLEYRVPDEENAFTEYRKAISLYQQPSEPVKELRDQILEEGWHIDNDLIRDFLAENNKALSTWKRGTTKDRALYLPAGEYELDMDLDLIQEMRELHRTVMLLCKKIESEGNPQEAWEWYRASVRASRHVGKHGTMIERLVGASIFSSCVVQLKSWSADPRLESQDLNVALEQLQTDWKLTESASITFKMEYLTFQKTLNLFGEKLNSEEGWPSFIPDPAALIGESELSRRLWRIYLSNQLMFCDKDRNERPALVPSLYVFDDSEGFVLGNTQWDVGKFEQAVNRSIIAKLVLPTGHQLLNATDRDEARYRCLLVALASQAYFRDHGEFPADAVELMPEYLDEIPDDLYSPTPAPLIYRRDGEGAVVYSRFENELDDGGGVVDYQEMARRGDLPDLGIRIQHPFGKPLRAPKPLLN